METILSLGFSLASLTQKLQQDWIAYRIDQVIWIRGKNSLDLSLEDLKQRLQRVFSCIPNLQLGAVGLSKDKSTYHLSLRPDRSEVIRELKQFLAHFAGKSLFSEPPPKSISPPGNFPSR